MEQPLVSVIVPVYNAKLHIARCVESTRRQSYPNLEIILVNDGSSDVSLQVADVYARADKRILLIDDICTSGRTSDTFKERMESAGAHVRMAMFLAKTKNYRRTNNYKYN